MDTLPSAAMAGSAGTGVGLDAATDTGCGAGLAAALDGAALGAAAAGFALDAGARFSNCRSVVCSDPNISGVSASTMAVTTGKPLTYVPLVLPKSSMDHRPSARGVAAR